MALNCLVLKTTAVKYHLEVVTISPALAYVYKSSTRLGHSYALVLRQLKAAINQKVYET